MTTSFHDTYEIKSIIGKGGMSTVYLAEHKRLHTRWALKEVRKQQGARFDFLAESNILKRLQHPMLPRIVDIFEDEQCVYVVEDFVEGVSLDDLLKKQGRISEAQGTQWFNDLCGVLRYLHTQNPPIIYRDMKPSNIMLQPDGALKLIDFGIAREYKQESNADTTYIGTKGYAAPEQFGKAQTDARTDIYALGVTMYHLLTGKSPYEPPYQLVPVRQLVPGLSRGIEHVIDRCVQPEPEARYQSVDELLNDLAHSYRYDKAWKHVQAVKRVRIAVVAVLAAAGIGLIGGGWALMGRAEEDRYVALLAQANSLCATDYDAAMAALDEARSIADGRIDADRVETYALYCSGDWQGCVDFGNAALARHGEQDPQIRLTMASAQFELGDYEAAAEGFAQGSDLSEDNLRDYAVCLGRLGRVDQAQRVLEDLSRQGARSDVTLYVQGELYYAREDYVAAEDAFLEALEQSESAAMSRRCYISLGDLYRDCAALQRVSGSPIPNPASKSAELLANAVVQEGLRYDSVLWEMLALAYFESYHTDPGVPGDYLQRSADCFNRVIELGVVKTYLYTNLYTIYYEMQNYGAAEQALSDYEQMYPDDYMPHALRGMMLITIENQKPQDSRNYQPALAEYEAAGALLRSSDETTYYQQLGSLIDSLRANGWLS